MTDFYQELGRCIRTRREECGLNQSQLALEIGVSRPSLTNMELGKQRIRVLQFVQIAKVLEVSVEDLLEYI